MRAAYYDRPGPARDVLVVGELPRPSPAVGEVLVRVVVSGVNPSDVKSRSADGLAPTFPRVVPHSDGAGVITAVGPGIDPVRVGERVWTWNAQWRRPFGTAADYVSLPAARAVPPPDRVPFEVGACLGVPWLTAWRAVHYRPPSPGEAMLVQGGAGAVGFYAIQLAKRAGFRVATTVSSDEKAALARAAGADLVVDYKREDVAAAIDTFTDGMGVDRIVEVDLRANAPSYVRLLRRDGLVIAYGSGDHPHHLLRGGSWATSSPAPRHGRCPRRQVRSSRAIGGPSRAPPRPGQPSGPGDHGPGVTGLRTASRSAAMIRPQALARSFGGAEAV